MPASDLLPAPESYFRQSPHETVHRENLACAALGLEPINGAFSTCVRNLSNTFYAIDHPLN